MQWAVNHVIIVVNKSRKSVAATTIQTSKMSIYANTIKSFPSEYSIMISVRNVTLKHSNVRRIRNCLRRTATIFGLK